MPPVDRNKPKRAASSESQLSLMEFMREFPDDAACLEWLWRNKHSQDGETAYCPKCDLDRHFRRYHDQKAGKTRVRQVWSCTSCSHQISPTAGTVFHKSSTSLQLWFYAIWLITSTRCGVSAKQLERELGVTYKTAWRMFNLIRNELMEQDNTPLSGDVEADETFVGGKIRESERRKFAAEGRSNLGPMTKPRSVVFAAVERGPGGRVRAAVLPGKKRSGPVISRTLREFVLPGSMVFTDDWGGYDPLNKPWRYHHRRINHSQRIYVDGDVHTQTIEGFFGLFKTGVRGAYHSISEKWMQGYLNEYAWRYNHRDDPQAMFRLLLDRASRPASS